MQSLHVLHFLRHLYVPSDRFIGWLPLISRPSRFNISDDEANGRASVAAGLANKQHVCRRAGLICYLQNSDDFSKQFNQLRIRRKQFQDPEVLAKVRRQHVRCFAVETRPIEVHCDASGVDCPCETRFEPNQHTQLPVE